MNLRQWLRKTGTSCARLGLEIGLTERQVRNILDIKTRIKNNLLDNAVLIEEATKGEVSRFEVLFPELTREKGLVLRDENYVKKDDATWHDRMKKEVLGFIEEKEPVDSERDAEKPKT